MALKNENDRTYLRVLLTDGAPLNLAQKVFYCEASYDQEARNDSTEWARGKKFPKFNMAGSPEAPLWTLKLDGDTALNEIADEFYDKITSEAINEKLGTTGEWVRQD